MTSSSARVHLAIFSPIFASTTAPLRAFGDETEPFGPAEGGSAISANSRGLSRWDALSAQREKARIQRKFLGKYYQDRHTSIYGKNGIRCRYGMIDDLRLNPLFPSRTLSCKSLALLAHMMRNQMRKHPPNRTLYHNLYVRNTYKNVRKTSSFSNIFTNSNFQT